MVSGLVGVLGLREVQGVHSVETVMMEVVGHELVVVDLAAQVDLTGQVDITAKVDFTAAVEKGNIYIHQRPLEEGAPRGAI